MSQVLLKGYWTAEGFATVDLSAPFEIIPCELPSGFQDSPHGHYHRIDFGTLVALYAVNDRLYLQINAQRWDIETARISVRTRQSFFRTFWRTATIHAGWQRVYRSRYCYYGEGGLTTILPLDCIDEEADDWWLWLSRTFPNQKSWMRHKEFLSKGIKQPS